MDPEVVGELAEVLGTIVFMGVMSEGLEDIPQPLCGDVASTR